MNIKLILIYITVYLISYSTYAQTIKTNSQNINPIIDQIIGFDRNNEDYNKLINHFSLIIDNPIHINTATQTQLEQLYILNTSQITNIIEYRQKHGNIYSIYELKNVEGLNKDILQIISPFLSFSSQRTIRNTYKKAKHSFIARYQSIIEKEKAYKQISTNKYQGDRTKLYSRYSYQSASKRLKFGFTTEKDPGESFFAGNNKQGFDYYSAHIQYETKKIVKRINIGDYKLSFAQGLVMWSGMSMGKSTNICQHAKLMQGQKAYTSTNENQFLRGISIHLKPHKNIDLISFISYKKKDSEISENDSLKYSSYIIQGGLHRTKSEIAKKNKLKEKIWGSNILISLKKIKLGATFINYNYSPKILGKNKMYNKFDFSGSKNYNYSIYYQTKYKDINLFGEFASSKNSAKALIQGININTLSQVQLEIIYRNYSKQYNAYFANAFADQQKIKNEEGIYMGIEILPIRKIKIHMYLDLFKHKWLKYRINSPSTSSDFLCQINYKPDINTEIYLRYRTKQNAENNTNNRINYPISKTKTQTRINIKHSFSDQWAIQNRIETAKHIKQKVKLNAYMVYQDIIYNNKKVPLSIKFRYAIFNTDSYHTRIYAYENDLLYTFSIPAYYFKGTRIYLNIKYQVSNKLKLYAKIAQTKYNNKKNIGSGNATILGNKKTEVKIQAIIKL